MTVDDPLIAGDEDDLGDGDEDGQPAEDDAQPRVSSPDVEQCPYCDHTAEGALRKAWMGRHKKENHPEEFAAEKAAKDSGTATVRTPIGRSRARSSTRTKSDRQPRGSANAAMRDVHDNVVLFYRMGGSVLAFRDPICGQAVQSAADNAARAWVELAKSNQAVRKFWSGGGGATGWLELTMAHLPILLAVQGHHVMPALERRRAAREAAMMFPDGGPVIDEDEPVVYSPNGREPAFDPDGHGEHRDAGPFGAFLADGTPFTEGAVG